MSCGPGSSDEEDFDDPAPMMIDTVGIVKETNSVSIGPMFEQEDVGTQYAPPRVD